MTKEYCIHVAFEFQCSECNSKLDATINQYNDVEIKPCDLCLRTRYQDGLEDGERRAKNGM